MKSCRTTLGLIVAFAALLSWSLPASSESSPGETLIAKAQKKSKNKGKSKTIKDRFAELKAKGLLIDVKIDPNEVIDEIDLEMAANDMGGLTTVSKGRSPKMPDTNKVIKVVNQHIREVKFCYKKQIGGEIDFEDELILEMTILTSGRLREMLVDPEEYGEGPFGKCMQRWTQKWRFPKFTGEVDEGVFQDNISLALPLRFSPQ